MATEAQIAANRRNAQKSTGPRTEEGKKRSSLNALEHGCRSRVLVLPTEDFGEFERQSRDWQLSFRPRNSAEEILVERLIRLDWLSKRILQAETARLTSRMHHTSTDESQAEEDEVIDWSLRLFREVHAARAIPSQHAAGDASEMTGKPTCLEDVIGEDHPMRLIHRLKGTLTGCEWMLEEWNHLRDLLESELPWLPSDQFKAVRLLGYNPTDVLDSTDVARVYLAGHVLLDSAGEPFGEVLKELPPESAPTYENCLRLRAYDKLKPKDATAARAMLMDIIDRAVEKVEETAVVLREVAEIDESLAAYRGSWDDTPEGERLRRYELTCRRDWQRTFALLLKIRETGAELDIATISAMRQSLPRTSFGTIERSITDEMNGVTSASEPATVPEAPSEANLARRSAPSQANSRHEAPMSERGDSGREFRIDTPHREHKPGGIGRTGTEGRHPVLERVIGGGNATLMDLSPIFGER
jgi:hypothetical protein